MREDGAGGGVGGGGQPIQTDFTSGMAGALPDTHISVSKLCHSDLCCPKPILKWCP